MSNTDSVHKGVRLALNLRDITEGLDPDVTKLLKGRLDLQAPILVERDVVMVSGVRCGDKDENSVPFLCDLLMAAQITDMVRGRDLQGGDYPTRAYIQRKKKGPWERLSGNVTLTEKAGGRVRLSTKVFPAEVLPITAPSGLDITL